MDLCPPGLFCFRRQDHLGVNRPPQVLEALWRLAGLPVEALEHAELTGHEPSVPSSFPLGTALQATLAAAALSGGELGWQRGLSTERGAQRQMVSVDMAHAAVEALAHHRIDGRVPDAWDPLSGIYPCAAGGASGWVRIHANFKHHRDGALKLLGLPAGERVSREQVTQALSRWRALDFEDAAAEAGLVVAALRSFEEWDRHPQALAVRVRPVLSIERIEGGGRRGAAPVAGVAA